MWLWCALAGIEGRWRIKECRVHARGTLDKAAGNQLRVDARGKGRALLDEIGQDKVKNSGRVDRELHITSALINHEAACDRGSGANLKLDGWVARIPPALWAEMV
jgi:hypothetical protein